MKYKVQIKPGYKHGVNKQYTGGDEIVVGELELRDFGDKFTNVRPYPGEQEVPQDNAEGDADDSDDTDTGFDLESATAKQVLAAVEDGLVSADDALAAEMKRPQPRKSVLEALSSPEE